MIDPLLREKLKALEKRLCDSILGQEEVIRVIVPILINGELGINSEGKPKANAGGQPKISRASPVAFAASRSSRSTQRQQSKCLGRWPAPEARGCTWRAPCLWWLVCGS
jgi:hypothetical protein